MSSRPSLVSVSEAVSRCEDRIKPRMNRDYLQALLSFENPDLRALISEFRQWSSYDEYLVLRKDSDLDNGLEFKAVKMAKRGNDVYAHRVEKRLRGLEDLPNINWFNPQDRSSKHETGGLFVTLTYSRHCLRLDEAWERVGEDYNRWISAMRARYGKIHHFRTWEAQQDGWPHVHAILFFEDQLFEAFFYHGEWRVEDKREMEDLWPHGFVDVSALASLRGGIRYVSKYLMKINSALSGGEEEVDLVDEEGDLPREGRGLSGLVSRASALTMALTWGMRRRAFSVSRGLFDLTTHLHNSKSGQVDLFGEAVYRWVLVGFWGGDLGRWVRSLSFGEFRALKGSPSWSDRSF